MVSVSGTLLDFNAQTLGTGARVVFTPSGPGFSTSALLAARPIVVQPTSSGSFTVDLQPTTSVAPETWYTIRIDWLDADGGYIASNLIESPLIVPDSGGKLVDLLDVPRPPTLTYVSLTPPINPTPGMAWLESDPDNPDNPLNTGNLYEWSA